MAISCSWCKQAVSGAHPAPPPRLSPGWHWVGAPHAWAQAQLSCGPSSLVPQQGVLLHAAADRGAVLPGGPRCCGHPTNLDPPCPQAPGESCLHPWRHLHAWALPATPAHLPCHQCPCFLFRIPSRQARRKREHPSRGNLARKGQRLVLGLGGQLEGNRKRGACFMTY